MFRLLYLGNGWADCVEIWHALGDPLVTAYAVVTGGLSLHVTKISSGGSLKKVGRIVFVSLSVCVSKHFRE